MKLGYISLMVRDMDKSLSFYQELAGLEIVRRFNPGMGDIAFLAGGQHETMIELVAIAGTQKAESKGIVFSFHAGDALGDVREKAVRMGYSPSPIAAQGPKPAHFTVLDPDGVMIEFSA